MNRKIPQDAFGYYYSLGPDRAYETVALHYGVSKRAITKVAKRENWRERITMIEQEANERVDEKLTESLEEMNQRHLKMIKIVQRKALETLKSMSLNSATDAVRAIDMAVKQERLIRGEPTDRAALNIEEVIRKEYERWMSDGSGDSGYDANESFL